MKQDLNTLREQQLQISMEADILGIGRATAEFAKKLQSYVSGLKSYIHDVITPMRGENVVGFHPDTRITKKLERVQYGNALELAVFVPPGLKTNWLEYLDALDHSQHLVDDLVQDVLRPAIVFFSEMVGSPEKLTSVIQGNNSAIIDRSSDLSKAKAEISKCFGDTKGGSDEAKFGDVFGRNADWKEANDRLSNLTGQLAKNPPRSVAESTGELTKLMETLLIRMRQDPERYQVSGIRAKDLSDIAYNLGLEMEFYAAHFYMVQVAVVAMTDTAKRLNTSID